jgi:hypothetical protein
MGNETKDYLRSFHGSAVCDLRKPVHKFNGKLLFHFRSLSLGQFPTSENLNCMEHLQDFPLVWLLLTQQPCYVVWSAKEVEIISDAPYFSSMFNEFCLHHGIKGNRQICVNKVMSW